MHNILEGEQKYLPESFIGIKVAVLQVNHQVINVSIYNEFGTIEKENVSALLLHD